MREIKFRAWDKRKFVMREVATLQLNRVTKKISGVSYWVYWNGSLELKSLHAKKIDVMQYTGLKDKNGVEIYEGDIIGNPNNKEKDNWYVSHHVVEWFDTGFVGKQLCSSGRIGLEYWTRGENGYVVIGNIYETPELLQEGK